MRKMSHVIAIRASLEARVSFAMPPPLTKLQILALAQLIALIRIEQSVPLPGSGVEIIEWKYTHF